MTLAADIGPSPRLARGLRGLYMGRWDGHPWAKWLLEMFPQYYTLPDGRVEFGQFHAEFWEWVFAIERDQRPDAFIGVWPRDTGKSTNLEVAFAYLGCEGVRSYGLYCCDTQDRADDHVQNIAALLESPAIAARYPQHAERKVGKYNQSRGWRINRLRTAGGFTVDAIGLDKAIRGARLEQERPDLLGLDDIDKLHEPQRSVTKKIETLTQSLLPAGNRNRLAVGYMQNIVHEGGVMTQLVDNKARFLRARKLSGPFPAFSDLTYEDRDGKVVLTGGRPNWGGFNLKAAQRIIEDVGPTAFMREYQQKRQKGMGALWRQEEIDQHRISRPQLPALRRVAIGVDPQISSKRTGSETGIISAALGQDGHGYVLADGSGFYTPDEWAVEALRQFDLCDGSWIVGEVNNGGDLVEMNVRRLRAAVPFEGVRATRGKFTRAEPIVQLYERGLVHHVGVLQMLEDQMTTPYDPDSTEITWDRMDALVWALWRLMVEEDPRRAYDRSKHRR